MTSPLYLKNGSTQTLHKHSERSITMNLIHEDLARAHMNARLQEARIARRGRSLVAARRLSLKAERAAAQARLAVARVI